MVSLVASPVHMCLLESFVFIAAVLATKSIPLWAPKIHLVVYTYYSILFVEPLVCLELIACIYYTSTLLLTKYSIYTCSICCFLKYILVYIPPDENQSVFLLMTTRRRSIVLGGSICP